MKTRVLLCSLLVSASALLLGTEARADLILNATGISLGFTATNVVTGLPEINTEGPFGLTVVGNGSGGFNLLVNDAANNTLYVFNDVDNQTTANALSAQPFGAASQGFATLNGVAYGSNGSVYGSFTSTGAFTPFNIAGLPAPGFGMAGDSVTGELITVSAAGLIAINPTTHTFRIINPAVNSAGIYDGVAISPDGQTVYVAQFGGNVTGYNVHTGTLVFTGPVPVNPPGGLYFPDGTAVITSNNALNGDILVNTNPGNVFLINPNTNSITLIGTNTNERGDYASPDFSNGTLLLDYSNQIERLSCGPGCSIGSSIPPTPAAVPEPGTFVLLSIGMLGVGLRKLFS